MRYCPQCGIKLKVLAANDNPPVAVKQVASASKTEPSLQSASSPERKPPKKKETQKSEKDNREEQVSDTSSKQKPTSEQINTRQELEWDQTDEKVMIAGVMFLKLAAAVAIPSVPVRIIALGLLAYDIKKHIIDPYRTHGKLDFFNESSEEHPNLFHQAKLWKRVGIAVGCLLIFSVIFVAWTEGRIKDKIVGSWVAQYEKDFTPFMAAKDGSTHTLSSEEYLDIHNDQSFNCASHFVYHIEQEGHRFTFVADILEAGEWKLSADELLMTTNKTVFENRQTMYDGHLSDGEVVVRIGDDPYSMNQFWSMLEVAFDQQDEETRQVVENITDTALKLRISDTEGIEDTTVATISYIRRFK